MSRSLNKIQLIGHVGQEPEIRTTASGKRVANLSLATSFGKGDKERTNWHRLVAWEGNADIIEKYVQKGDRIYVEGSMEYTRQETDSGTRFYADVVVREVILLSGKAKGDEYGDRPAQAASSRAASPSPSPFDDFDDDLPF